MKRQGRHLIVSLWLLATGAQAEPTHDHFVMALSWSPTWCAEAPREDAAQCRPGRDLGWVLHGLWPQAPRGWPEYCATPHSAPSPAELDSVADLFPSRGLARHQWRKHGSCSGLSVADYFALSRRAYEALNRPPAFRALDQPVRLPADLVEEAFLAANPALDGSAVVVTCAQGRVDELRLCLTTDLRPRPCTAQVASRACGLTDALLPAAP